MSQKTGPRTSTSATAPSVRQRRQSPVDSDLRSAVAAERLTQSNSTATALRLAALSLPAMCGVVAAIATGHPLMWVAASSAVTIFLLSMQFAIHEAIHGSLYRSNRANEITGAMLGAISFIHFAPYRSYHLEHHRRTHEEGDPEPVVVIRSRLQYLGAVVGAMPAFAGGLTWNLIRSAVGHPVDYAHLTRKAHLDALGVIGLFAAVGAATGLVLTGNAVALLAFWLGPSLMALIIGGVFVLPEHYGCAYGPATPIETSRTTQSNRFVRFLMWNGNFHTAHHLIPSVTAPNLPRLDELIGEMEHRAPSYSQFHRSLWNDLAAGKTVNSPPWEHGATTIDLR